MVGLGGMWFGSDHLTLQKAVCAHSVLECQTAQRSILYLEFDSRSNVIMKTSQNLALGISVGAEAHFGPRRGR